MGDGVLAYFGWPQVHEDEAERAVRAGLDLVAAVAGLATPADASLAARVGIATGRVVVGELIGAGSAQEEAVVGETPNLAARLQALAEPGSVVISGRTRRLVGGLFELVDLGPQQLRGFAEPVRAFGVEGEGRAEGRFEALHGEHLTPLVGREHELGILLERWG
jgi:class 3 adenylate cyclase